MFSLTRRSFLKALASAGIYGSVLPFGLTNLSFASAPTNNNILIVLHLRGGCDGLNFISPSNDPDFIAARNSDLRVLDSGNDAGFSLANGLDKNIDFRLHHSAGGLAELYKNGNLGFVHACGLTDATRSHFVATDMIENGVGTEANLSRSNSGWLARAIETQKKIGFNGLNAISINGSITGDLHGLDRVLAIPDISKNGLPYIGGAGVTTALWDMYGNHTGPIGDAGRQALQLPIIIDEKIERDAQGHVLNYQSSSTPSYDAAGNLANAFKSVARLIKMDIGLQAITMDYGNWDTHEYQNGHFKSLMEPLSNGIAAFWNDMAAYHDRITLVTVTEFGRRLRSNKSNGTDHGRAGVMTILGGNVKGGKIYGKWPGLHTEQLDEGVDLAVTTDYRRVLTEVLNNVNGKSNSVIFPDYNYEGKLGIF
jgi:uncharacterized protein (DUF1501 family)